MRAEASTLVHARTPEQVASARALFQEYADNLGVDLCFQGFARELADLPGAYGAPDGRLLLALVAGQSAGCVALRKIGDGICEMKRLYVRPAFRGRGLGRRLAVGVIESAREMGYRAMRLDTLDTLQEARGLYRSLGFRETAPYNEHPHAGTIFMELDLAARPGTDPPGP